METLLVKVVINKVEQSDVYVVLENKAGELFASKNTLQQWHMSLPYPKDILYQGTPYYRLSKQAGFSYQLDKATLHLTIKAEAKAFIPQHYSPPQEQYQATKPSHAGLYFNYDLNVPPQTQSSSGFPVNGIYEMGYFGPFGVINQDILANFSAFQAQRFITGENVIRLNSTWTVDSPDKMLSYRFGDTLTRPGMWGNSVAIGGLQFGTNFSTQPRFITHPLPTIRGQAVMPSVVDVFVNNAQVYQQRVPPGPFDINALPTLDGQGEITMIRRDMLGRTQVISLPYYASTNLLKADLTDYSIDVGFVRNNFGLNSFNYGQWVIAGTFRKGVSDRFTEEVHSTIQAHVQTFGLGGTTLVKNIGSLDFSFALSHSHNSPGALIDVGFERNASPINIGSELTFKTKSFRQLGDGNLASPTKIQASLFAGITLSENSNIGISYVAQKFYDRADIHLLSANYTMNFPNHWFLTFSGLTNLGGQRTQAAFLTLTHRLSDNDTSSLNIANQTQGAQQGLVFNHMALERNGLNYYVSAEKGDTSNIQTGLDYTNEHGNYSLQVAHQQHQTNYTLNASGSIVILAKQLLFAPKITNSFGVIQVPGYEGVGVFLDNQLVAQTNQSGYAFIPYLNAYDDNKLSIDPSKLPIDAEIIENERHIFPYFRSGTLIRFGIKPNHAAIVTIINEKGSNLPTGTKLLINEKIYALPVGFEGQAYLKGLQPGINVIKAELTTGFCHFDINYTISNNSLPNLGKVICRTH